MGRVGGGGAGGGAWWGGAERRGLDSGVVMPPRPKENMPAVWSLCDVALVHLKDSPVFAGVIPSKICEAMAMGLPVLLAAPEGEASRVLGEDEAGLRVPAEDPDALAGAVVKLMQEDDFRRPLARRSLAAAPRHTREPQARPPIQVLALAAAGRRAGAARARGT